MYLRVVHMSWLSKDRIANIVSAVIIIGVLAYGIYTQNTNIISFLAGYAVGYLYKTVRSKPS